MTKSRKATLEWLAIVGLGGSVLGTVEALWLLRQAPPLSVTEAALVLSWACLGYAAPALLLAGGWLGIAWFHKRAAGQEAGIPAALFPVGFWVVVLIVSQLQGQGRLAVFLIELPAGVALTVGLCLFLRNRWPASLNSAYVWALLQGLILSASALWLATRYAVDGQMLVVVPAAVAAGGYCVWGLAKSASRKMAVVGASSFVVAALMLLALWPGGHPEAKARTDAQRNVLLITVDTLRADHLGSYGYTKGQTPTMDAMAIEGVLFEEAHAQSPFTCPSHASILTGLDPFQHGAFNNSTPLGDKVLTLTEILKHHGYETAAFVSASPVKHGVCGLGAGFHTYGEDLSPWRWLPQLATKVRAIRILKPAAMRLELDFWRYERAAEETTDEVLRWLTQGHDRPFFLWVHYFDPHLPFAPPPPYDRIFDPDYTGPAVGHWYGLNTQARERITSSSKDLHHMIALYDGEVAYVDGQIRRLREALIESRLEGNTLVILTADHGESHGEHDRYFARDLHRPSLHVPLIFNFPEGWGRGRRLSDQVRLIDIAPTVLNYLHINAEVRAEGKSLLSLIHGGQGNEHRPAFAVFPTGQLSSNDRGMVALQDNGYKLIWSSAWWYGDGVRVPPREELYNVRSDPQEEHNILEQETAVLPELRRQLTRWRDQRWPDRYTPAVEVQKMLRSLGYVQ